MNIQRHQNGMTLWGVASLGIGSMIGAGIFALLGQATLLAGRDVVWSFVLAGTTALLSGYCYARLAARYPSSSGILAYYSHGFDTPLLSASLSLLYLITLAVSCSMLAKTFGAYAASIYPINLLGLDHRVSSNLFASAILIFLAWLNMTGSRSVGRAESFIVGLKLLILLMLMLAGLPSLTTAHIENEPSVGFVPLMGSVGLTFFAFAGFGMMTNASGEVKDPAKTIPRAIFIAISLVLIIYVGLALIVLGNMSVTELVRYADTAMARAAEPILGAFGFFIVSFAALLATTSGINAMLFSGMRIAKGMALKQQLPAMFARPFGGHGTKGLIWSVAGILVITNIFDLRAIANIASSTFLICYLAVFVAGWRLKHITKTARWPLVLGFISMLTVLLFFMASLWRTSITSLGFIALFIIMGFCTEWLLLRHAQK